MEMHAGLTLHPQLLIYKTSIREDSLIEMIEYLIDNNIYIKVGSKVFRQQVGIPMGTDCVPLLANLFCSVMNISA